ncbi:hypothetical protein FTUN_8113 [Frigoriglobus tundricola]|uniref:Uncharacterized protein n=1 Tax=Frigoriglobus tundricola TaxID=2774151 RepID=A0A6M5Z5F0_9BACT|nr:hypothetical protein FTUN_8113 [Frigoriglobus tundricola]
MKWNATGHESQRKKQGLIAGQNERIRAGFWNSSRSGY